MPVLAFGLALASSLLLIPLVRRVSIRLGKVARPREDRWHSKPTPTLGGVGIFLAFLIALLASVLISGGMQNWQWGLLVGSVVVFILGLYDDFRQISPPAKLVGQILAASLVIFFGYTTEFFSPRIGNPLLAQGLNSLLTFVWLVGITNAINLLDNMDGLAGGISFITAAIISYFFWRVGNEALLFTSLSLAGAILGFLIFNFPPASIFMGDGGSLFLGFTLAVLAIARQPQASNVFAVMGVPTMLFLLPILDTFLVTFTRLLRGQSPAEGGRDHTSHRLIAFGLSERQAVLAMYAVALVSGVLAATLESLRYWLSLALVPVVVITLALLTAYLGGLKVVPDISVEDVRDRSLARIMMELTMRRRLLEIVLDFFLISVVYYLAFLTRLGFVMNEEYLAVFLQTAPVVLGAVYLSFYTFGVYRGVWRYVGFDDLVGYFKSALGGAGLSAALVYLVFDFSLLSWQVFLLFFLFLFLGLAATRSSFRLMDRFSGQRARPMEQRVLIWGADDEGEMTLRWIHANPQLKYRVVGFLDPDPFKQGRQIHGVAVLGSLERLDEVLEQNHVDGLVLSPSPSQNTEITRRIVSLCSSHGCWVKSLKLEFEVLG